MLGHLAGDHECVGLTSMTATPHSRALPDLLNVTYSLRDPVKHQCNVVAKSAWRKQIRGIFDVIFECVDEMFNRLKSNRTFGSDFSLESSQCIYA